MRHNHFQAPTLKTVAKGLMTFSIAIALHLSSNTASKALAANLSTAQPSTAERSGDQPQQIAQATYISQIRDRLIRVGGYAIQQGYSVTHEPSFDQLRENQYQWITIKLRGGTNYLLTGLCDQDCQDLDLAIYDENGNLVKRDTQIDATPVVSVTPQWTGNFRIRVSMAKTTAAYSYYGVAVFGK